MPYVTGAPTSDSSGERASVFLDALASADQPDSLVVQRGRHAFIVMNLYPYNTGHMMVVPNRRVAALDMLDAAELADIMQLAAHATSVAGAVLKCDGFNVGLNIGAVAGAGISEHLHVHVVPRWHGDANFMPITAGTLVLPELLPATTARIKGEFEARAARASNARLRSTAGALVYLAAEGRFVVRRSKDGSIVMPKGHIEAGEAAADAALREVHEETGFQATVTGWLGSDRFDHDQRNFHTVYFLASGRRTSEVDAHLAQDTLLAEPGDLVEVLSFPRLTELARRALDLLALQAPDSGDAR
jgi:ATP adenylyltransferase